jgi:predicted nucleotidyltransferase component of viral defense system
MPDIGASILAQLKRKAKESGKPFQLYLQLFCQEEFLRRLSYSKYADNLVLKGGMLIYTLTNYESRPTIDIDFLLHNQSGNIEDTQKMVDEIITVETGNDYIQLRSKSFETISTQRKYEGVSFQLIGQIKNTKTPFNVDVGVGDVIVPKSQKRKIPVQLEDFTVPEIMTYSLESTIAEKLDALMQRLELTSRMKDIYDIFYLSNLFDFDGRQLQQAVYETLTNRGTPYKHDSLDQVVALAQVPDIQVRWRQFLHHTKLPELALDQVFSGIEIFLHPVWDSIIKGDKLQKTWSAKRSEWS